MNNEESILWQAPQKVTDWQRIKAKNFVRSIWIATAKFGWPLMLIGLSAAYIWGPLAYGEQSDDYINRFLMLTIFLPPGLALFYTSIGLRGIFLSKNDRYEINEKGPSRYGYSTMGVSWRRLDRYRFRDHEDLEGICVFEFTAKPIKYIGDKKEHWNKFYFDPKEIDENQIQKIVDLYLTL